MHGLRSRTRIAVVSLAAALAVMSSAYAHGPAPGEVVTIDTPHGFNELVQRLESSIAKHHMGLVAKASASAAASARGVGIPGNAVLMVFRNDYAVRMLAASVPAGIEAPLRLYVTESPGGRAAISYLRPSAVFAPYGNAALNELARELDPVIEAIVAGAAAN